MFAAGVCAQNIQYFPSWSVQSGRKRTRERERGGLAQYDRKTERMIIMRAFSQCHGHWIKWQDSTVNDSTALYAWGLISKVCSLRYTQGRTHRYQAGKQPCCSSQLVYHNTFLAIRGMREMGTGNDSTALYARGLISKVCSLRCTQGRTYRYQAGKLPCCSSH